MNRPKSFCLRAYAIVLFLFQSLSGLMAQSPDSFAGATVDMYITHGAGGYGNEEFTSSGRFLLLFRGNSNWIKYNVNGVTDSSGNYIYYRTSYDTSETHFDSFSGCDFIFETPKIGRFGRWVRNSPSYQNGTFRIYTGESPQSLNQKIIQVQSAAGTLNFGGGGNYNLVTTSPSDYFVQNAAGTVLHSGTYSYAKTNRASGVFRYQDTLHGAGFAVLTFENNTTGLSLVRKNSNQTAQLGIFSVTTLTPPTFSAQPTSRNVAVGTSTTFSASATGTGSISYQWYKDDVLIGSATNATYTIPSVQLWDAGNYRVVATGAGGSTSSVSATLVPVCGYSLSSNTLFVDFRGGENTITVFASGTCAWTAASQNNWITITSAAAGQGNSTLSITVAPNNSDVPRTGTLLVAGKTLVIAQGVPFTPADIAGKTFRLDFTSAGPSDALLIAGSGTNQELRLVPLDFNSVSTFEYTYVAHSSSNAAIQYALTEISLNFDSAKSGTFESRVFGESDVHTGTFVMNSSAPDFNDDARGDLVLQGATGGFASWYLRNTNFLGVQLLRDGLAPNGGGRGFGAADFNRDGYSDLAIQDSAGRVLVWFMQGTNRIGGVTLRNGTAAAGWRAFSTADVNGDGHPDVLFQNINDRRLTAWLFDGTTFAGGYSIRNGQPLAAGWRAVGAADMNYDGYVDIISQHDSGKISVWFLNGGEFVSVELLRDGLAAAKWKVMGAGDINEDGSNDLLFQNDSNQVATWLFQGKTFVKSIFLRDGKAAGSGWKVVAPR